MKNKKKYVYIIITFLMAVFTFNIDAYAGDLICKYKWSENVSIEFYKNSDGTYYTFANHSAGVSSATNPDIVDIKGINGEYAAGLGYYNVDTSKWKFTCPNGKDCCPNVYTKLEELKGIKRLYVYYSPLNGYSLLKNTGTSVPMIGDNVPVTVTKTDHTCTSDEENIIINTLDEYKETFLSNTKSEIEREFKNIQEKVDNGVVTNPYSDFRYLALTTLKGQMVPEKRQLLETKFIEITNSYKCNSTKVTNRIEQLSEQLKTQLNNYIDSTFDKYTKTAVDNGQMSQDQAQYVQQHSDEVQEEVTKQMEQVTKNIEEYSEISKLQEINNLGCDSILGQALVDEINDILLWIRVLVPILLIVLGSVDFSKAVMFQEKDELKKATSTFTKRCIIAVVIFFVPLMLNILIDIFNNVSDVPIVPLKGCGID